MEAEDRAPFVPCAVASGSDRPVHNGRVQSMRLRTIVIDNFKNYIGKHEIDVGGEAFVCFFGRNGAGKSCVVDAIAFCLGATPQQLRVKRLAHLVNDFAATSNPEAFASVILCFDISGGTGQKECIWVKRMVEATTSQTRYFCKEKKSLDWTSTSKGALETTLRQFGMDMRLQDRFIIRQANATGLAQMTSIQLLHFCERIIGTYELKDELAMINRKWKERSESIDLLRERITAKEGEAMQCQPMVSKFQDWVEKREKIRAAQQEAALSLLKVDQLILTHERTTLEHVKNARKLKRCEEKDLRCVIDQSEKDKARLLHSFEGHQQVVSEAVQLLRQRTRAKAKRSTALQSVRSERCAIAARVAHFTRERADAVASMNELQAQLVSNSMLLAEKQTLLQAVEEAIVAHQEEADGKQSHDNEIQYLVREIDRMEAARREETSKQRKNRQMRSDVETRFTAIEKEAEMCMQEKDRHEEEIIQRERTLMEDIQAIKGLKDAQTKLRGQVECVEADIRLLVHQKSKSTSRSKAERTIQQMQESLGNHVVLGRLREQAIVESKYVTAVNSALQTQLQYVVVRDREIAVSVSRVYAEKSIGRVSCCVLDDFKDKFRCDPSACGLSSGVNDGDHETVPLCQVVTCTSEPIRRVFHKFGHNWMVCKDADQAAMLSHNGSKNFVTLQGDLFFADGSIRTCRHESAKSNTNNSAPLVRSEIPDSESHQRSISVLSSQLENCRARHEQGERKIQELTKRVQSNRHAIDVSKGELEGVCATMRTHNTKLEQARQSLLQHDSLPDESLLTESQEWKSKLAQLKKRKARLTKRTSDKERASLLTRQAQILREIEPLRTRESSTTTNVIKLRGKEQAISHQLATLGEKAGRLLHEQETLQDELKQAEDQMEAVVQKVDVEKASLARTKSKLEDLEAEIRSQRTQLDIVRSEVRELGTKEDDISIKIDSLRKEIDETELTTEQDEPMEDHPLDQLEDQRSKIHQDLRSQTEEQRVMEQVKSSISVETVERAIACEHEIASFRAELDSSSAELTSLSIHQHETAVARHEKLLEALRVVNENFSRIYRLMNEDGDCYLGYSLERTTLFSEGVTLNCKPDESHWQPFVGLSGGQQVVCAVSLMLALQASFPNPFYVCDEIDAALDTVNVQKLAELLRDQSSQSMTQFLVVSHRPEMWEIAKYLVGVYERERSAQIISCRFE